MGEITACLYSGENDLEEVKNDAGEKEGEMSMSGWRAGPSAQV